MVTQTQPRYCSPEVYLELEETAEYKSEYREGEIIPMRGGSTVHNDIAGNIYAHLKFALRRKPYKVFIGNVHLWSILGPERTPCPMYGRMAVRP